MRKAIRIFDFVLLLLCMILFGIIIWANASLPSGIIAYDGQNDGLGVFSVSSVKNQNVPVASQTAKKKTKSLKLLGAIPVKEVSVTNKNTKDVYVSGEVFGIKLYTNGVIVVGTQAVETDDGPKNPCLDSGIEVGDIIIAINGTKVYTSDDVEKILNDNNGKAYRLKIKRDERYREFDLIPVYVSREGCYKAGMWVRDSTAGIGTMTYYDEQTKTFGALGHQINDVDTNELMPLLAGEAVSTKISNVIKGTSGVTGSLECEFSTKSLGKIEQNTKSGIFGTYKTLNNALQKYPVAAIGEVKRGYVQVLSTVDENGPRLYDAEITRISYNEKNKEKNMIIKITDSSLIEKTGGIVQGMSGSPIIQNGRLVGALTHVIVNNPQKGYAIFAQTMIEHS